jgi:twitching motility protein PilT
VIRSDSTHPSFDLASALERVVEQGGSDLHIKVGNRPLVRVGGRLRPLDDDSMRLQVWDTEQVLHDLLPSSKIKEFESNNEVDFAYSAPGLARFRANAYRQRGAVSVVMRVVPGAVHSITELGLPDVVVRLAEEERGVILVAGTTGSGKSTTLAAMIEHINATMCKHVVTIEDPIEYLFADKQASIDQREIGGDTESFRTALRYLMRQDPDVILIGEMRDEETVRTALSAAETGHLVFSTVHTLDATETVNRILDFFSPHHHQQIRAMLAGALKGIISQRLVPSASGSGRVAITEVLTMTGRVRDMILNPEETGRLNDVIAEGEYYGMQTFDQALYRAIRRGQITLEEGRRYATSPHDLKLLLDAEGRMGTTMDDVPERDTGPPKRGPAGNGHAEDPHAAFFQR